MMTSDVRGEDVAGGLKVLALRVGAGVMLVAWVAVFVAGAVLAVKGANEITVGATVSVRNGSLVLSRQAQGVQRDQANLGASHSVQRVGTSWEALAVGGDIGTSGWVWVQNLAGDPGPWVRIGVDTAEEAWAELGPGDVAVWPAAGNGAKVIAQSNAAPLDVFVLEQ